MKKIPEEDKRMSGNGAGSENGFLQVAVGSSWVQDVAAWCRRKKRGKSGKGGK